MAMKRRSFLQSSLGVSGFAALGLGSQVDAGRVAGLHWRDRSLTGLGTLLSLRVAHTDAAVAEQALDAAVTRIRHVEDQMSLFRPESALSRLNRDGVLVSPHADLFKILHIAQTISQRSQGAFDVTVQPLWAAFASAQHQGGLPTPAAVTQARTAVGWQKLAVSPQEIRLEPGMAVTLNGIAQGFAADTVRETLQAMGIRHALINTGEWAALGQSSAGSEWHLGIANPRDAQALVARLALHGRCIATSADNECSFSPDLKHHHIFDPHTGYSPTDLASVTVAATTCTVADALTKVMFVAGYQGALRLARLWDVEVLVVGKNGEWQATPGLRLG